MTSYAVGDRVTYHGPDNGADGVSGTVESTKLIESGSTRDPFPTYQRVQVKLDPNPAYVWTVEAAARFFAPAE